MFDMAVNLTERTELKCICACSLTNCFWLIIEKQLVFERKMKTGIVKELEQIKG